jgi:RNA polymerase sigma-70 factor (ECF subfamily)
MLDTDELYRTYAPSLKTFFLTHASADCADDMLQELFLRVHRYLVTDHASIMNPHSWLFRCARNLLIDYYRSSGAADLQLDLDVQSPVLDRVTEKKLVLSSCLSEYIEQLPEQYAHVINAHVCEHRTHKEIAEHRSETIPAVKNRLMRAKRKLFRSLEDCCSLEFNEQSEFVDYTPRDHTSQTCCL